MVWCSNHEGLIEECNALSRALMRAGLCRYVGGDLPPYLIPHVAARTSYCHELSHSLSKNGASSAA